ncbi:MAG: hypothetical protein ACR5LC_07470 [Symbiopectobacterium sp.]|uniref:hypothetical protein n=1 Tax=Symbiopectobacterium sp. TaxID=2952789 RepID=UPI003F416BCC
MALLLSDVRACSLTTSVSSVARWIKLSGEFAAAVLDEEEEMADVGDVVGRSPGIGVPGLLTGCMMDSSLRERHPAFPGSPE